MIEKELIDLIKKIKNMKCETQNIELKAAKVDCPKRLYDTLSAFSNQDSGGILVFGIDEQAGYEVVGVYDAQDLQKKVTEQCKQMVPKVRAVFTTVLYEGKIVVCAEIPGIDITERPCYYGGVGKVKGSYIRVGDSDEPMSDYEIYSYEAFRKKYQDDIRINEKATMDTLDVRKLERYLEIIKDNSPKLAILPDDTIKRLMNMIVEGKQTLACIILFSIYPQMFYPQYTINATVVPGYEKGEITQEGSRFIDNKRIEGTIDELLEGAIKFIQKNMAVKTIIDTETGKRNDKTEYPIIAVREAVLNALIHRDYSIHTEAMPIEVTMYKDRLEIRNPGGLYGRMTIDSLGKTQPDTRNPILARAMETLGFTENRYSGIPTIKRAMREAGLPEVEFIDSRNEFRVIFYNTAVDAMRDDFVWPNVMIDLLTEERHIIEFCKIPRTRQEISEMLGISTVTYTTKQYIKPLVKSGILKMTIPEKPTSKHQKYFVE